METNYCKSRSKKGCESCESYAGCKEYTILNLESAKKELQQMIESADPFDDETKAKIEIIKQRIAKVERKIKDF
jgi:positive regulator of sigma E activity